MAKGFKHGGGGGAALNFTVVGGTEQPARAKENTIWINTDQKITGWVFSRKEPEEPAVGTVWFPTGTYSSAAFNALKKNDIQVYPMAANMYTADGWGGVEAQIYQDGVWADWLMTIFKNGEFASGTWESYRTDSYCTVQLTEGELYVKVSGGSAYPSTAMVFTSEKFNTTGRSAIVFVVSKAHTQGGGSPKNFVFGISATGQDDSFVVKKSVASYSGTEPMEIVVPITPESYGEYYIKAGIEFRGNYGDYIYISEIRMQ